MAFVFDTEITKIKKDILDSITSNSLSVYSYDFMDIYDSILHMCKYHRCEQQLYIAMKEILFQNMENIKISLSHYLSFFKIDIQNKYKNYILLNKIQYIVTFISKLFSYLDKFYTKQNNVPRVKKTLYLEFNDSKYKNIFFNTIYKVDSNNTLNKVIIDIECEWLKLIKSYQCLLLAKLDISNDVIETVYKYMNTPCKLVILKELGLTSKAGLLKYPKLSDHKKYYTLRMCQEKAKYDKLIYDLDVEYSINKYNMRKKDIYDKYQDRIKNL